MIDRISYNYCSALFLNYQKGLMYCTETWGNAAFYPRSMFNASQRKVAITRGFVT
jgi:hypothetical protein